MKKEKIIEENKGFSKMTLELREYEIGLFLAEIQTGKYKKNTFEERSKNGFISEIENIKKIAKEDLNKFEVLIQNTTQSKLKKEITLEKNKFDSSIKKVLQEAQSRLQEIDHEYKIEKQLKLKNGVKKLLNKSTVFDCIKNALEKKGK